MAGKYDSFGLYHDRDDPRLIVPKSNPSMGWTLNVAHRYAPAAVIGVALLIALLTATLVATR